MLLVDKIIVGMVLGLFLIAASCFMYIVMI